MVVEFEFPDVGEGVTEGKLIAWLVDVGDEVEEDESLAEVETDKAVVEVPAPTSGTIKELRAEEGADIKVGDVILVIDDGSGEAAADTGDEETEEATDEDQDTADEAEDTDEDDAAEEKEETEEAESEEEHHESTSIVGELEDGDAAAEDTSGEASETKKKDSGPSSGGGQVLAAPSTRKLAREKDIDIAQVDGTGPGGRVTTEDVERYAESGGSTRETADEPQETDSGGGKVLATPKVRRLAKDEGVDLATVNGSGPGGRITEDDVEQAASGGAAEAEADEAAPSEVGPEGGLQPPAKGARLSGRPNFEAQHVDFEQWGDVEREEMSRTRRAIAEHMERSKYVAPHVTATDDADVTALWNVREKEKEVAAEKDVHLTFLPFIAKAVVSALKDYPVMNASLDEETGEIVKKQYYNIGVAVATDHGLLVPVIKNADQKSILALGREMNDKAEQARNREISLDDMRGGTFTLTNYGSIGGKYGTPIINYPEVGILGLGTIRKEPVVRNDEVVIRRILPLSLTFDHRVVDGAYAAQFMNEVITHLEDPDLLLIDE